MNPIETPKIPKPETLNLIASFVFVLARSLILLLYIVF